MPTYSIDGPDGKTYSVDGPPGATREQVIAQITKQMGQEPAPSAAWETAKDIGRGAAHGIARGIEELPQQIPFAGLRRAVTTATAPIASKLKEYGPMEQTKKYVAPPETPYGVAAEHVAGAVPTAPLQPGGPITKAVTTLGVGLGEYGGEELAKDFGLPPGAGRFLGALIGGGITGGGAQLTAEMRARRSLPTSQQTRTYSKGMYDLVEQHGLMIEPTEVQNFAAGLRADLDRVYMTDLGGRTGYTAAERIEHANGDLAVIMDEYRNLGNVKPNAGPNYASAQIARDSIIEWIGNLQQNQVVSGDPAFISTAWQQARDAWRAHARLDALDRALESGEWRRLASGQGANLNTMRQQIRKIIDNDNQARRYTPEERLQMAHIVEGTLAQNVLRLGASLAPHGAVSGLPSLLVGLHSGALPALAVAAGAEGLFLLRWGLEQRSVALLRDLIRERAPQFTGAQRAARARLLAPGRTGVATARGALAAGADSPLAEGMPQE